MEKKYEVRAEIRIELTQENIDDIMVTALEGGGTFLVQRSVAGVR